jgi:DNA cross-link repair 1A protein
LEAKKGLAKIRQTAVTSERERSLTPDFWGDNEDFLKADDKRYNESDTAVKRRRVESPDSPVSETQQSDAESKTTKAPAATPAPAKVQKRSGPFIDESDSEDDMQAYRELQESTPTTRDVTNETSQMDTIVATQRTSEPTPQPLVRTATNNADNDEYANFDDIEEEDELIGEEFRNRPWEGEEQEQQIDLEVDPDKYLNDCSGVEDVEGEVSMCPICQMKLKELNETVSVHHCPLGLLKC